MDKIILDIEEYKTFNKDLETSRLAAFRELMSGNSIRFSDLLKAFVADESFKRLLERKIGKLFGKKDHLTPKDLMRLERLIKECRE